MRISDWSSDVCSSDLCRLNGLLAIVEWLGLFLAQVLGGFLAFSGLVDQLGDPIGGCLLIDGIANKEALRGFRQVLHIGQGCFVRRRLRSEEHTSELQSLMRTQYAVFLLTNTNYTTHIYTIID